MMPTAPGSKPGLVKPPKRRGTRSCTRSCGGSKTSSPFAATSPAPTSSRSRDLEKTIKWLRRQLKLPPPGEKRRPPRPAEPEPEPIIEEPPDQHICWHEARRQWGWRCRGDHTNDLLDHFRCLPGRRRMRWFWSAKAHEETVIERHGFEPSAVRARIKARMAVVDLADGRPTIARASDDQAAWALRKLSRDRPPERPKATDLLGVLKAAMVNAHPDKGGSAAAFIAARQRYVEARRRIRAA